MFILPFCKIEEWLVFCFIIDLGSMVMHYELRRSSTPEKRGRVNRDAPLQNGFVLYLNTSWGFLLHVKTYAST